MTGKCDFDVCVELVHIKRNFRQVNVVGTELREACRCGEPACVTAHDFNDGDCLGGVNRAVTDDFLHGGGNELRRGTVAGGVVGAGEVVVDGLRNADRTHLVVRGLQIFAQLCNGVHGVVAADVEEVADVVLLEDGDQVFVEGRIVRGLRELVAAGAESCRGSVDEELLLFFVDGSVRSREEFAEVAETFLQQSFDPVFHAVKSGHRAGAVLFAEISVDYAGKRSVNGSSRTAGLSDNRRTA